MILLFFFFFNDTATTEIYTLSLHDALPISAVSHGVVGCGQQPRRVRRSGHRARGVGHAGWSRRLEPDDLTGRSEEHTSELQSRSDLVCRLLLAKKKRNMRCDAWTMPIDLHI